MAFAVAALLGWAAWRARTLTGSGALGAGLIGGVALSAGRAWGAYLLVWFLIASGASRLGRGVKAQRGAAIVTKNDRRDLAQVLANGGAFAVAAVSAMSAPTETAATVGAAALAAAGADTLATEVGMLWGRDPWSLRIWRRVPSGTSGAVTAIGLLALCVGALCFAVLAAACGLIGRTALLPVTAAAVIGAMIDTGLGAWGQVRRWCPTCRTDTEQPIHACGTHTPRVGGLAWLDNDAVNAVCTVSAAGAAWLLAG